MEGILTTIVESRKNELAEERARLPLKEIKARLRDVEPCRNLLSSIVPSEGNPLRLIAEIKKRSPIKGLLIEDLKVDELARRYEEGGAAAISVLTERKFFYGDPGHIRIVKDVSSLPVLRKDFLFEEYQIYESRYIGADAILLIVSILDQVALTDFIALSSGLGMSCIVEIHDEWELEKALKGDAVIIGINNRDLTTFKIDIETTLRIIKEVPEGKIVVSESGIYNRGDVQRLADAGVHAILVGESIITSKDVVSRIRELLGVGA